MAQAKTLTKTELKKLCYVTRACRKYAERDVTMLQLTHYCGMRVGEVAALQFADVVDEQGTVLDEIVLEAERTKSKRARRIFLPKHMQRQLQQFVDRQATAKAGTAYLFSTQKQLRFTANTASQHLRRLYAKAAIAGATSHSGRRTYLTELAAKGVSVRVLAEMAGHASIQTTQRYIDVNDDMMRNACELIK